MVVAEACAPCECERTTGPSGSLRTLPIIAFPLPEPRLSSVLSGRDRFLIGLFVLVNVAVILVVVLLRSSGDDDGSKKGTAQAVPRAGRVVVNRAIGARIRKPRAWSAKRGERAITLRSPDSTTIMSISQPPGAVRSRNLVSAAVAAIRQDYSRVSTRRLPGKVAGLPTVSRVVSATNQKRVRLNILVSAPQGRGRAWLVEVFSGPGARVKRLPEAQVALRTLRLSG